MPSSHPTNLTFCQFAQPLVGKTAENDKTAKNENFISQFLLLLVCKTNEFAKNAINQKFEAAAIPAGNLAGLCPAKKYIAISVTNNLRSKFFVMYIALPLVCKSCKIAKNAKNWNLEAVAIPARNLVRLSLTKKYIASWVMNNQRSWFFINYIEAVAIPLLNLVRLSLTRIYKTSWVTNNWRMPIVRHVCCAMNNQRSWFFINYIAINLRQSTGLKNL